MEGADTGVRFFAGGRGAITRRIRRGSVASLPTIKNRITDMKKAEHQGSAFVFSNHGRVISR